MSECAHIIIMRAKRKKEKKNWFRNKFYIYENTKKKVAATKLVNIRNGEKLERGSNDQAYLLLQTLW